MNEKKMKEMILYNGKIITMSLANDIVEAVLIRNGKIMAVGSNAEILSYSCGQTNKIDLGWKSATPGFIESHCHTSRVGPALIHEVNVKRAESIHDIIHLLRQKALQTPKGKWVIGRNYDDKRLKDRRHPTKDDLDQVTADHPVFLRRLDGHLGVANRAALRMAHIHRETPNPEGGKIDREPQSREPSGLLLELAQDLVTQHIPPYTIQEVKEGISKGCQKLAQWGITSFTDALVEHDSFVAYQELCAEGALPIRAGMIFPWFSVLGSEAYESELRKIGLRAGYGNDRLRVIGTKFMVDGSMSGRTAALYQPYQGSASELGILVIGEEELKQGVVEAHELGLRPCIHAIGDRAIDLALDAVEAALKQRPQPQHKMRIEHCSLPSREAIKRIRALGVIPSTAIGFLYELGSAHLELIGEARQQYYLPLRSFQENGIIAIGHSDWMVTSANPLQQIYGAVTRKSYLGKAIGENQSIGPIDAMRMFTTNAAYGNFGDNVKGSIEPGKVADIIVIDKDISTIDPDEILDVNVDMTLVEGKIIYCRDQTFCA